MGTVSREGRELGDMDKAYEYAKSAIVNFKLDTSFCFAPIRIGVIIIGYFNLFIAMLSLIGTADGGITPPLMEVQDTLLEEDQVSMSAGIVAYAFELAFSVVLLCAMYRNDIELLRVHIYFTMATVVTSILMYSMVIAKVCLLTKLTIISNIVFNCYVIILVRSAMVEIKERRTLEKNGHVVLYSVATVSHEDNKKVIDIQPIVDPNDPKIEVINEESKKNDKTGEESKKDDKIGIEPKKDDKIGKESKKDDKTGKESKKADKIGKESKKDDKIGKESKKDDKIVEEPKTSKAEEQTRAPFETVNENPTEGQSTSTLKKSFLRY